MVNRLMSIIMNLFARIDGWYIYSVSIKMFIYSFQMRVLLFLWLVGTFESR